LQQQSLNAGDFCPPQGAILDQNQPRMTLITRMENKISANIRAIRGSILPVFLFAACRAARRASSPAAENLPCIISSEPTPVPAARLA
jgi:hypothetical protein